MYKSFGLQQRKSGLTHGQYVDHWFNVHAPMSAGVENLFGYVCNEVVDDVTPKDAQRLKIDAQIDGIAQMWFDQPDGLLGLAKQPGVQNWFSDGPNFVGERIGYVGEEQVLTVPQRGQNTSNKLVVLIASADGRKPDSFWATLHDVFIAAPEQNSPGVGLVMSRIVSANASANMSGFAADNVVGVVEVWLGARDTPARVVAQMQALMADLNPAICVFQVIETVIEPPISQATA